MTGAGSHLEIVMQIKTSRNKKKLKEQKSKPEGRSKRTPKKVLRDL